MGSYARYRVVRFEDMCDHAAARLANNLDAFSIVRVPSFDDCTKRWKRMSIHLMKCD
jgi:hypothetical protein